MNIASRRRALLMSTATEYKYKVYQGIYHVEGSNVKTITLPVPGISSSDHLVFCQGIVDNKSDYYQVDYANQLLGFSIATNYDMTNTANNFKISYGVNAGGTGGDYWTNTISAATLGDNQVQLRQTLRAYIQGIDIKYIVVWM